MTPADETADETTATDEIVELDEASAVSVDDKTDDDDHTPETEVPEAGSEEGEASAAADDSAPVAPDGTDWEKHGPVLWDLLHRVLGSPKQKHEGHYQVKVDDKTVGDAHDAIAAIQQPHSDE